MFFLPADALRIRNEKLNCKEEADTKVTLGSKLFRYCSKNFSENKQKDEMQLISDCPHSSRVLKNVTKHIA